MSNESLSDMFTRYATEDREQAAYYGGHCHAFIEACHYTDEFDTGLMMALAVANLHSALMFARSAVKHQEEADQARAREIELAHLAEPIFAEPELCTRWGQAEDRCLEPYGHVGPCRDASGETTLTLAARILGR